MKHKWAISHGDGISKDSQVVVVKICRITTKQYYYEKQTPNVKQKFYLNLNVGSLYARKFYVNLNVGSLYAGKEHVLDLPPLFSYKGELLYGHKKENLTLFFFLEAWKLE